jgi:dolichyl-phosphate-mannose--protein O-mannosyl transferase
MPALAGSLIPLAVFLFLIAIGLDRRFAFFAGVSLVLENALLAEARLILLDNFMILFGFLGLWLFFAARRRSYPVLLCLASGCALGLSFSVKWTGLSFWLFVGLVVVFDLLQRRITGTATRVITRVLVPLVVVPLAVYSAVFAVHFALLTRCGTESWNGCPYMTADFRDGRLGYFGKFLELNGKMFIYNANLKATHSYASRAWTWPFMYKPVYFWNRDAGSLFSRIYLIGNPFVWLCGLVGVIGFLAAWRRLVIPLEFRGFLVLGYLTNWLPFFSVERVLFLYHYLVALIFSLAMFWILVASFARSWTPRERTMIIGMLVCGITIWFAVFSPLTYGLPLSLQHINARLWFSAWR